MVPAHWPPHILYLLDPSYHSSVPPSLRSYLTGPAHQRHRRTTPSPSLVSIRAITAPSHPAFGQYGLFAYKKIPPHAHIIDYVGQVHCEDRISDYDLSLYRTREGINVGVDARLMGNEARFINDYRGVRERPNAVFIERRTDSGELRMSVWSGKEGIKKGSEIVVSYGKSWWGARGWAPQ
jgi:hypothetical protein